MSSFILNHSYLCSSILLILYWIAFLIMQYRSDLNYEYLHDFEVLPYLDKTLRAPVRAVKYRGYNRHEISRNFSATAVDEKEGLLIATPLGIEKVEKGRWIIEDVKGRYYHTCDESTFKRCYKKSLLLAKRRKQICQQT